MKIGKRLNKTERAIMQVMFSNGRHNSWLFAASVDEGRKTSRYVEAAKNLVTRGMAHKVYRDPKTHFLDERFDIVIQMDVKYRAWMQLDPELQSL